MCVGGFKSDEEPGALEDIRKQLSDRFDLAVDVERPREIQIVKDILSVKINNYNGKKENIINLKPYDEEELCTLDKIYEEVIITNDILTILATIYIDYDIESIRGIESLLTSASLHSALNKRKLVTVEDLYFSTPLALGHRTDISTLTKIMKYLENYMVETSTEQPSIMADENMIKDINIPKISFNKDILNRDNQMKKIPLYQKILDTLRKRLKNNYSSKQTAEQNMIADPDKIEIKSSGIKAIPIKDLGIKDLVKTEEELYESNSDIKSGRNYQQ